MFIIKYSLTILLRSSDLRAESLHPLYLPTPPQPLTTTFLFCFYDLYFFFPFLDSTYKLHKKGPLSHMNIKILSNSTGYHLKKKKKKRLKAYPLKPGIIQIFIVTRIVKSQELLSILFFAYMEIPIKKTRKKEGRREGNI